MLLGKRRHDRLALPPIVLVFDGERFRLADGFHRPDVHKDAGLEARKGRLMRRLPRLVSGGGLPDLLVRDQLPVGLHGSKAPLQRLRNLFGQLGVLTIRLQVRDALKLLAEAPLCPHNLLVS